MPGKRNDDRNSGADKSGSKRERDNARTMNDPKRIKREQDKREQERRSRKGNGKK